MTDFENFFSSMRGKNVSVIGMGISNMPLIKLLCSYGANVTVHDRQNKADDETLNNNRLLLKTLGAEAVFGEHYLDNLSSEYIFRTPGLLPTEPKLAKAIERGVTVSSEMELFYKLCPAKIIGITGSDGKTTTSTLIAKLLEASGHRVFLGGNIGTPLLDKIPTMSSDDFAVTELSSFQLMDMTRSPEVAVVTNVSPNHLDKHTDMNEYVDAKRNIFSHQTNNGRLVYNTENVYTAEFAKSARGETVGFSSKACSGCEFGLEDGYIVRRFDDGSTRRIVSRDDILLPGVHNAENYMAAIAATEKYVTDDAIHTVATSFGGVEHRCEFVREFNGVKYYNSSIDSSPTRTIAALSAFEQKLTVIAGGYDKKIPFDALGEPMVKKAKRLILIGATAEKIADAVKRAEGYSPTTPEIIFSADLEAAVNCAAEVSENGDTVILSPACASFDSFKNFEERGQVFKKAVRRLK